MTVNERIKKRREDLELSATEVANKLGISRATLYRYEKADISKIPSDILDRLGKIYRISLSELMGHDSEISATEYTYALYNETKDLSEDAKNQLLAMARFLNSEEKKRRDKT